MKKSITLKNTLYWLPKVLSILLILFISIFALDVFGESQWFLALIMHLIPSFILITLTIIAWKNEKIGGILFILVGIAMSFFFHFETLFITIPTSIIGILFLVNYFLYKK